MIRARDVMQASVLTVSPGMSLTELEDFLVSKRITGAPVVERGVLIGIVSRSDIVRLLIEKGADTNARDKWQQTPLHYAAVQGHINLAELLTLLRLRAQRTAGGSTIPVSSVTARRPTAGAPSR